MSGVLFLVHRIPLPPDKGDKIRSFNLLKALRSRYDVFVGTFADSVQDLHLGDELRRQCTDCFVGRLRPQWRRLRSVSGLLRQQSLTLAYYADSDLQRWVGRVIAERGIERVVAFSSSMAQFVPATATKVRRIIDFCDIDSEKWAQYAERREGPMGWVFRREHARLQAAERAIAQQFDASLFVSEREAEEFRRIAPESASKVFAVRNGVDAAFFDPALVHPSPFPAGERSIVFTGAMDYWANVDAVSWFANELLPGIKERVAAARFYIVGAQPARAVRRLSVVPGVVVTGRVDDVRPYLQHAHAVVAPLRVARGVQNKVLEALAMSKRVVTARAAVAGLSYPVPSEMTVVDDANGWIRAVADALDAGSVPISVAAARAYVLEHYDWRRNLDAFLEIVDGKADRAGLRVTAA